MENPMNSLNRDGEKNLPNNKYMKNIVCFFLGHRYMPTGHNAFTFKKDALYSFFCSRCWKSTFLNRKKALKIPTNKVKTYELTK